MAKTTNEATLKVSLECNKVIDELNAKTKIPKKYIVELAVNEYLKKYFGKEEK